MVEGKLRKVIKNCSVCVLFILIPSLFADDLHEKLYFCKKFS